MRNDRDLKSGRRLHVKNQVKLSCLQISRINYRLQLERRWEPLVWLALALIPYLQKELWLYLLLASALFFSPVAPVKPRGLPVAGFWLGWGFCASLWSMEPGQAMVHWIKEMVVSLGGIGAGQYLKRKPVGWGIFFTFSLPVIFLGVVQTVKKSAYPLEWVSPERAPGVFTRITGTLGNPNLLGEYLSFLLFLALGAGLAGLKSSRGKPDRLHRWRYAGGWFIVLAPLYALLLYPTFSRTAWWSAIISALSFVIPEKRRGWRRSGVILLFFLVLLQPLYLSAIAGQPTLSHGTLGYRLKIWAGTWELIKKFPYSGVGSGNFSRYYPFFSIYQADHAHNLYLQIVAEKGFPGLLIFSILLYHVLSLPVGDLADRGVKAALFTQVVAGIAEFVWAAPLMLCLFWLGYGYLMEAGDG